jgi:hypothetical protein
MQSVAKIIKKDTMIMNHYEGGTYVIASTNKLESQ